MPTDRATFAPGELTAGRYLRLRRERGGFSLRRLASAYAPSEEATIAAELMLSGAELDRTPLAPSAIARVAQLLPISAETYLDLAGDVPVSGLCRTCASAFAEPCAGPDATACPWARSERHAA